MDPSFPPPKGGEGGSAPIPSQLHVCAPTSSLSPCLPTGKGREENTRIHLGSSLGVSSPILDSPKGGGGGGRRRGVVEEATGLEARQDGVLAIGPVGLPAW